MKSRADRLRTSLICLAASTVLAACSNDPNWYVPMLVPPPLTVAEEADLRSLSPTVDVCSDRHGCTQPIPFDKQSLALEITDTETPGLFKVYYRIEDRFAGDEADARLDRLLRAFCEDEPKPRFDVVIVVNSATPRPLFLQREFSCEPAQANGAAN